MSLTGAGDPVDVLEITGDLENWEMRQRLREAPPLPTWQPLAPGT